MKKIATFIYTSLVLALSNLAALELNEDQIIQLDGKITVAQESDQWFKVTVPFIVKQHPDVIKLEGKRPESIEAYFNPEFIDNLRVKIWISFLNEFKRSALKGDRKDVRFFEYYSAELECFALEIDRKTKKAEFLFPTLIAKMNELGNYPKFTGYALEFSRNGESFLVSNQINFLNFDNEDYLEKYRIEAINKSSENEGILIPAYLVNEGYLSNLGPIVRD
jgi:hypothetical protein